MNTTRSTFSSAHSTSTSKTAARRFLGAQQPHSPRKPAKVEESPAPGAYDAQVTTKIWKTSPRHTFGRRVKAAPETNQLTPGPGTYRSTAAAGRQVTSNKPSAPSFGFGSASRFGGGGSMSPRLMADVNSPRGSSGATRTKLTFSRADQRGVDGAFRRHAESLAAAHESPGPGAYRPNWSSVHASKSYSLSPRLSGPKPQSSIPGPGSYDVKSCFERKPERVPALPSMPMRDEGRLKMRVSDVPGPASYKPVTTRVEKKQGAHVFGTSPRFSEVHGYIPRA